MDKRVSLQNYTSSDLLSCHHGIGSINQTQGIGGLQVELIFLGLSSFLDRFVNGLEVDFVGRDELIEAVVFEVVLDDRFL